MQTMTHDQLKTAFHVPVTYRDQKELGFGDEPFKLVVETAQDGDRITREKAQAEAAKAKQEAASPMFAAVDGGDPERFAIAECGCTKYRLCPDAIRLARQLKSGNQAAGLEYSRHRNAAHAEIRQIARAV